MLTLDRPEKLQFYKNRGHNCHSVFRNNTSHLINHFDKILLTRTSSNNKNFFELVNVLKMEREESKKVWRGFLSKPESYPYLCLDTRTLETTVVTIDNFKLEGGQQAAAAKSDTFENAKKRVELIVSSCCSSPEVPMMLFQHIFRNIPISSLNQNDLSLKLQNKRNTIKISVCDLLYQATQDCNPTQEVLLLFAKLQKRFSIPLMLITNAKFKTK